MHFACFTFSPHSQGLILHQQDVGDTKLNVDHNLHVAPSETELITQAVSINKTNVSNCDCCGATVFIDHVHLSIIGSTGYQFRPGSLQVLV